MLGKFRSLFTKPVLELDMEGIHDALSGADDRGEKERLEANKIQVTAEVLKLNSMLEGLSAKRADDNYVNVLKDRFCEKSIKLLQQLPESYDMFISSLSAALKEISGISFKEFRHFHTFKEDMGRIASQIKNVEEKLDVLAKSYFSSSRKKVNYALNLANAVKQKHSELARLETELQEIEKAVPFLKESLESGERKLAEVSNKLDSIAREVHEKTASMESERSIIKQRIGTEFGSIDRLLKKLQHEDPKKYDFLSDYIRNPGDAFIADESLGIRTVLEELKVKSRKEDPEKCNKVIELLRNIDFFDSLRQQYKGIAERIMELREFRGDEIRPLEKEKNHLLMSIEESRAEIAQLMERRNIKSGERENIIQAVAREKAELTERLQDLLQREVVLK